MERVIMFLKNGSACGDICTELLKGIERIIPKTISKIEQYHQTMFKRTSESVNSTKSMESGIHLLHI